MQIHIEQLDVARWSGGAWHGQKAGIIRGFSIDTRLLQAGHVFVAIRGEKNDGHAYLAEAMRRGAAAVMIDDPGALRGMTIPHVLVSDTRRAFQNIAHGYLRMLACPVAAVTGSVGKTTVKELLADMMQAVGPTARTRGNWNNDLGVPLSILGASADTRFGIFEIGMNHPGELDPLCDILEPDLGLVTCVGPVHIENFENEHGIAVEKSAVYRGLKGQGVAVMNADDKHIGVMREYATGSRIIEVSGQRDADYMYRRLDPVAGIFEINERATGDKVECRASLPGDYFVMNAALSAAAARAFGAPWSAIQHAVQSYQPLTMRWNRQTFFGVHTVNDAYNANPVSLRAAIRAFMEEPVKGNRWLVLGGMLELGVNEDTYHHEAGAFIARTGDVHLITVGRLGALIASGARDAGMPADKVHMMSSHAEAAAILHASLNTGDSVLFKGSRGEAIERVLDDWKSLRDATRGE